MYVHAKKAMDEVILAVKLHSVGFKDSSTNENNTYNVNIPIATNFTNFIMIIFI